ncbi:GNAT family N-acetyltransferase [Streptomyces sp. NPDC102406]|uniref:GNAT family N-acetyltransferase n=1 Tax=Streptomyces sp. NPDC102406 TaxID=3366171 RepID=UPI00381DD62B
MPLVRRAVPGDAEELVRLREIMLASMNRSAADTPSTDASWQPTTIAVLRSRLADPGGELAAFVIDAPAEAGRLAACATGAIHRGLGAPGNPSGTSGHVFNVCTDPEYRRKGYSRACMEALLGWYRERGVRRIDLHATDQGEPLYTSLGFTRTPSPAMRLTL